MKSGSPGRHHFIPAFYIRRWAKPNGQVLRYTSVYRDKVVDRWKYPDGVGWLRDLYRMPDAPIDRQQIVESEILRGIDQEAANALDSLTVPMVPQLTGDKQHWTLFMLSIWQRAPVNLDATSEALTKLRAQASGIREHYASIREPDSPPTYDEFIANITKDEERGTAVRTAVQMISNTPIAEFLFNMEWLVIDIPPGGPLLLLSDDPIARTNGMQHKEGHFAMPLSPTRLLAGAWHPETLHWLHITPAYRLAKAMNKWVVQGARHFVVSSDERQSAFIRKHFGKSLRPPLAAAVRDEPI